MMTAVATMLCLLLLHCSHDQAPASSGAAERVVTLTLPRTAAGGETVHALVTVGPLPRGTRIHVRLPDGEPIGTIAPYGRNADRRGTHTMPIPADAVSGGTITLHLQLQEPRGAKRAPSEQEVESIELELRS